MIKEKQCKGQGLAKGFGCGKITKVENRIYGLGKMCGCYSDWLLNSDNGKIKMQKAILKTQEPRKQFEQALTDKKEKNGIAKSLLNTKKIVHTYVRKRDEFKPCISCGCTWNSDFQAGHFYAAGSFETLRFHLDNIHGQCQQCNLFKNGNFDNYALRLPERIGLEKYNVLVKLAQIDKQFTKVWTIDKLKEITNNIKKIKL